MARRRNRRKKQNSLNNAVSVITSIALLVIAVLMVIFVVFYITNNSFLKLPWLNNADTESISEADGETEGESETGFDAEAADELIGLCRLEDGEIVYIMDAEEAEKYDEGKLIEAPSARTDTLDKETPDNATGDKDIDKKVAEALKESAKKAAKRYYLTDSWLDLGGNLYHFDAEGHACRKAFKEGAFIYEYDDDGLLKKISYNKSYNGASAASSEELPGVIQTKTLWVYMDTTKTLGDYVTVMFKKTTDSLSHTLGGDLSPQYASKYAFDIVGGKIIYLAVPDGEISQDNIAAAGRSSGADSSDTGLSANQSGTDAVLSKIAGKVFCMTPGADYRELAAENAYGFKALADDGGQLVIYYYDGMGVHRSTQLKKDESMAVFSEDADYTVDISESGKAYLMLTSGQRVTLKSDSFKAGNFKYSLSSDGEILSVAEKTTVNTGGYTYSIENGEAFGEKMARVIRKNGDGATEVISSEFSGSTANIHFDYGSSSIIAEYVDGTGVGGLLKISLNGDVDIITDAASPGGTVVLYGIDGTNAIYKTTESAGTVFKKARIAASSPIAVAVEPISTVVSEGSGAPDTGTSAQGTNAQGSIETGAAPGAAQNETAAAGDGSTSIGTGPGGSGQ